MLYVFFGYALNVRCTFPGVARVTKEPGKHERAVWLVIFLHDSLSLFVFLEIVWIQNNGAENGTRTRDPHLGKVVLYH